MSGTNTLYVLFENSVGYALFLVKAPGGVIENEKDITDYSRFATLINMTAFKPFLQPESALTSIQNISTGTLGSDLEDFLRTNLPISGSKKPSSFRLGVSETKLGAAIQLGLNVTCQTDQHIQHIIRGIRLHFHKFVDIPEEDLDRAQLALAHAYSRSQVKFDVNRTDNMVKQAVFLFDQLEKDINMLGMRVKEWYGGHFPELPKIVVDNIIFAKIVIHIRDKATVNDEMIQQLEEITQDGAMAKNIVSAAKVSMGYDLSDIDIDHIVLFAQRTVDLAQYREELRGYLTHKMTSVAPNLTALLGVLVAARLVSHAGSLTSLSKSPASTIQILGAEKALFRALKSRSNTPKYGLLFNSGPVQRVPAKNKGRISRYLANKCALACRIDSFGEELTGEYGKAMKDQVELRVDELREGREIKGKEKNVDVMTKVSVRLNERQGMLKDEDAEEETSKKAKKDKKEKKDKEEKKGKEEKKEKKKDKEEKKEKKDKKEKKEKKNKEEEEVKKEKRSQSSKDEDKKKKKDKKEKKTK
ncbi:putative Nucleolar protein 56 [Blattamonas nauphoetae]|uniref:Nucleolar protein 56 n=1 Tax=Blattamonas nauphoetae TaxID=2049346 RepID=A0ABQ9XK68_9EUKA|nr:putative Nucleolar protein 56 [Blattamonas nauphoetae]